MEANAAKTKVRIGGNNGFRTNGIQIANMEQSGDWWFSVLMGSATEGSAEDGYKLSVPAGAYAQYNLPIKNLENNPVYINFNANLEGKTNWAPELPLSPGPTSIASRHPARAWPSGWWISPKPIPVTPTFWPGPERNGKR